MFTKYINKFGKAEAEWVMEILDMHNGDEEKAKEAIIASVHRLIKHRDNPHSPSELTDFDQRIDAAFFASRDWWLIGLSKLHQLGVIHS